MHAQVELNNLKAHSAAEAAERAMAEAEHEYLTSSMEMETLVQMMVRGRGETPERPKAPVRQSSRPCPCCG